jgi:CRP-like cAMP-binding protein
MRFKGGRRREGSRLSAVAIEDFERLRAVPLFSELSVATLQRLAEIASDTAVPAGQTLAQRDDPGSGMYVVEDGEVEVELHGRSVELGPGEFFGELSLLVPEARRSTRVRAVTAVQCLAFNRTDFAEILESEPALALAMLRSLARRLIAEVEAG